MFNSIVKSGFAVNVGGVVSSTVTVLVAVEELPVGSVAVHVIVYSPGIKTSAALKTLLVVSVSKPPLSTVIIAASPELSRADTIVGADKLKSSTLFISIGVGKLASVIVITGAIVSTTVTVLVTV